MTTNSELNETAAREWLLQRRSILQQEISTLQGRMREVDFLLTEIQLPVPRDHGAAMEQKINAAKSKSRKAHEQEILTLLRAAGPRGLPAKEIAGAMGTPLGTASSRLSVMQVEYGLIHHKPFYALAPEQFTLNGATP